jgi:hypothetical protein
MAPEEQCNSVYPHAVRVCFSANSPYVYQDRLPSTNSNGRRSVVGRSWLACGRGRPRPQRAFGPQDGCCLSNASSPEDTLDDFDEVLARPRLRQPAGCRWMDAAAMRSFNVRPRFGGTPPIERMSWQTARKRSPQGVSGGCSTYRGTACWKWRGGRVGVGSRWCHGGPAFRALCAARRATMPSRADGGFFGTWICGSACRRRHSSSTTST